MPTTNGEHLLKERYFQPGEDWPQLAARVGQAVGRSKLEQEIYTELIEQEEFLPNTPALVGAGTDLNQLAACFVLPVYDSMDGIFDAIKHAALVHKSGGGTGFDFSNLRPANSPVRSTKGVASGPLSFMEVFNAATNTIKQGGRRKGANMGVLRCDHPDILDFIQAKRFDQNKLTNFNISVGMTKRAMETGTVQFPDGEVLSTNEVLRQAAHSAWSLGEPGVLFLDNINRNLPLTHPGWLRAPNPCGEAPLLPFEACFLGSIDLNKVVDGKSLDWDALEGIVHHSIGLLDRMIDATNFPISAIRNAVLQTRKIGLGVMGLHDVLMKMEVPYDSEEGRQKAGQIMSFIQQAARVADWVYRENRGPCPVDLEFRNMTQTTVAPTGSLSMITGASMGIEPVFSLQQERTVLDGQRFQEVNGGFKTLLNRYSVFCRGDLPGSVARCCRTAQEIAPTDHVRMQAVVQEYVDNAVSKTVNLPNNASVDDIVDIFHLAHTLGCKGVTVYRDGSRDEQVLNCVECEI